MNDYQLASKSLQEEKKAVKDYKERRENSKSGELKKVFTHALEEEKTHAKMLSGIKGELSHEQKMTIIKKAAIASKK
jgi:hypothetical protein